MREAPVSSLTPNDILKGRDLSKLRKDEMKAVLKIILRDERVINDTYLSERYFNTVLDSYEGDQGVPVVASLIESHAKTLSDEGELDGHDLKNTPGEKAFKKLHWWKLRPKHMLRTVGYLPFGVTEIIHSGLQATYNLTSLPQVAEASDWMGRNAIPPTAVILGAALVSDGLYNLKRLKLDHIADGASELVQITLGRKKRASTRVK